MDLDSEGKRLDHENFSLQQLRDKKISAKLQKDNIRRYSIEWDMEKGLNPEKNARHKAYLDRLCEDVYEQILTVSEKRIAQLIPPKHIRDWIDDWHDDIEQHVRTVQLKAPNFVQRRKLTCYIQRLLRFEGFWVNKSELGDLNLTDIGYTEAKSGSKHRFWKVGKQEIERKPKNFFRNREYFEQLEAENETPKAEKHDTSDTVLVRKPVIVHGPSGFGKSSVLAKLFERFCSSSAEDRKV